MASEPPNAFRYFAGVIRSLSPNPSTLKVTLKEDEFGCGVIKVVVPIKELGGLQGKSRANFRALTTLLDRLNAVHDRRYVLDIRKGSLE